MPVKKSAVIIVFESPRLVLTIGEAALYLLGVSGIDESHNYHSRREYTSTKATSTSRTAMNLTLQYTFTGGDNGTAEARVSGPMEVRRWCARPK